MIEITKDNIVSEFQKLGIPIFTPGHREFELSVATPNFLYRFHRPEWVVRPRNGEDVAMTIRASNQIRAKVTVKNGGHNYAGFSNAKGGILLDMCDMRAVTIQDFVHGSKSERVVICSAGALWGDVYRELATNSRKYDGWLANGGRCPAVGVTGFILGGGFGPFSRSLGLGADQLKEVEVVTVTGELITITPEDTDDTQRQLFWALQGAGGGMFCIVTRLRIGLRWLESLNNELTRKLDPKLEDIENLPLRKRVVVSGRLTWIVKDPATLEPFKNLMVDFYQAKWDNRCTIDATWECNLERSTDERPFYTRFSAYYDGNMENFATEINSKLISSTEPEPVLYEDFRQQLKRRATQESLTQFLHETLWSQWREETRRSRPSERAYSLFSSWIIKNDDKENLQSMINTITNRIQRFRFKFTGEQGTFAVACIHIGGKISSVSPDGTAYPWRGGNYAVYILVRWHEKWLWTEMKTFFDETKTEMKKYAIGEKASYVNFPDRHLQGWAQAYYGDNLPRLEGVYQEWVTDRLFVINDDGTKFNPLLFKQSLGPPRPETLPESIPRSQSLGTTTFAAEEDAEEDYLEDLSCQWIDYVPPAKTYEDFVRHEPAFLLPC